MSIKQISAADVKYGREAWTTLTVEDDTQAVFVCLFSFRGGYVARSSTAITAQGDILDPIYSYSYLV